MSGKATTATQQKGVAAAKATKHSESKKQLNLTAMKQTPGFLIRLLQLQIFEEFFEFFADTGFSPATHSILIIVRDNPFITQSELAGVLRIQLPNLVKALVELEDLTLVERRRSTKDRRAVELSLTSKGRKTVGQLTRMANEFNTQLLSKLSDSDRENFVRLLAHLVKF